MSDPRKQALEDAVNANADASKKKKFEGAGGDGLTKVKDIDHVVKKEIPHTKGKVAALAWGPAPGDTRMAIVDQGGSAFVWDTKKRIKMYGCISTFAQCIALSPDEQAPVILVGSMRNLLVNLSSCVSSTSTSGRAPAGDEALVLASRATLGRHVLLACELAVLKPRGHIDTPHGRACGQPRCCHARTPGLTRALNASFGVASVAAARQRRSRGRTSR